MATFTVSILTVSDRCSRGEAVDKTGPALAEWCTHNGLKLLNRKVVPDNISEIQESVIEFCETCDLVLTTGGTGFGVRDFTPEAVEPLLSKKASGLTVAMLYGSLSKTPMAALSRPVCGVRLGQHQNTLVVTLPGSVKGAIENIENIKMVLNHALELVRGGTKAGEQKHAEMYLANNSCHCSARSSLIQTEAVQDFKSVSHGGKLAKRFRESPFKMVEFQTALDFVQLHSLRLETIEVSADSHLAGYVIAEDMVAQEPGMRFSLVPSYRASVVDGYAVVASDGPGIFPVAGFAAAGSKLPPELHSGQIIRVSTGAPLPVGSTAVVMVEDTKLLESSADESEECTVEILASAKENQFVREIGSDIKRGEIVLRKGHFVSGHGGEIGVLATLGISTIKVYRKPVVGVMSTGNELMEENSLGKKVGQIRDCNRPALIAAIKNAGYTAIDYGIASDR